MTPDFFGDNPFRRIKVSCLIFWTLVILILVGISLALVAPNSLNKPITNLYVGILVYVLIAAWAMQRCHSLEIEFQKIIGNKSINIRWFSIVGIVFSLIIFSIGSFYITYYLISLIAPELAEQVIKSSQSMYSPPTSGSLIYHTLLFLEIVVVAPIVEEFLFRGIILHRWAVKWGMKPAIVASSIFFGFCHLNFLGLSLFGVVMAILYIRTRSLVTPILAHALNNAIAFGLLLIQANSSPINSIPFLEQFHVLWWRGLVCLLVSLPFILRFLLKKSSTNSNVLPYFANS